MNSLPQAHALGNTCRDHFPCAKCGKLTQIDDLDGKPEPRINGYWHGIARSIWLWWQWNVRGIAGTSGWDDPDGNTDWNRLECGECYGPGYSSNRRAA